MASPLGRLLGRSPIAPIQRHMQLAEESVQLLCELIAAAADDEQTRVGEIHTLMATARSDARRLRHEIRQELPRGLLLAMPRPDLLTLVDLQQRICDQVRDTAQPVALRGLRLPPGLTKGVEKLCTQLAEAAGSTLTAIRELDEMLEQGFGKNERRYVTRMLDALGRQVQRCSAQQLRLAQQLQRYEGELDALDCLFLYRLIGDLSAIAEQCGDVGEQLHLLLAQ